MAYWRLAFKWCCKLDWFSRKRNSSKMTKESVVRSQYVAYSFFAGPEMLWILQPYAFCKQTAKIKKYL